MRIFEREHGALRIFGWLQFLWSWSGKARHQWAWVEDRAGTHGYLLFYGVALGDTFFGVVR